MSTFPAFRAPLHHLLLATEDFGLLSTICMALQDEPFLIGLVRSRAELLSERYRGTYDIVLVDELIGAVEGWRFANDLHRASGSRTIVVMGLVSVLSEAAVSRQRELGIAGFVRKAGISRKLSDGIQILARNVTLRAAEPNELYLEPHARRRLGFDSRPADKMTGSASAPVAEELLPLAATKVIGSQSRPAMAGGEPRGDADAPVDPDATIHVAPDNAARTPPLAADLSGTTLGKVKLIRIIGSGAGGTVYEGLHTSLGISLAVKVLRDELVRADPEFAMRFLSEARTAARVSHANIVHVYDCDRDDAATGAYYIVMEYVKGNSLEEEIRKLGKIPEKRLVEIAIGVASALVAAELVGVIHRDIKPANIMLCRDDQVKVTDLGLAQPAKQLSGIGVAKQLGSTRLGKAEAPTSVNIVGTPYYMSPEQITNSSKVDVRADIYSLGATLYHALTGEVPFPGKGVSDVLLHQLETDPTPVEQKVDSVSPTFAKLIMKMLEKDPAKRPAGHRDVLSILRDHQQKMVDEERWKRKSLFARIARTVTRTK